MFLKPSNIIDNNLLFDNLKIFQSDYFKFKEKGYFFDYSHNRDEVLHSPKRTNYFWQVCPLMYNRDDFPISPEEVKKSESIKILKQISPLPLIATFSIMTGNSEIPLHTDHDDDVGSLNNKIPHKDRTTSVVKYHLSLDVPLDGECAMIVKDETKVLKTGDLVIFDETDSHGAYNRSKNIRGVLIISFLRHEIY
jgi:aspartyl/asparaginyl beta-hydroxylase (cupin superfamily)